MCLPHIQRLSRFKDHSTLSKSESELTMSCVQTTIILCGKLEVTSGRGCKT